MKLVVYPVITLFDMAGNVIFAPLKEVGLIKHIRNITGCPKQQFKYALDKFLCSIPDEPHITGIQEVRLADSNSLIDQIVRFGFNELEG